MPVLILLDEDVGDDKRVEPVGEPVRVETIGRHPGICTAGHGPPHIGIPETGFRHQLVKQACLRLGFERVGELHAGARSRKSLLMRLQPEEMPTTDGHHIIDGVGTQKPEISDRNCRTINRNKPVNDISGPAHPFRGTWQSGMCRVCPHDVLDRNDALFSQTPPSSPSPSSSFMPV